MNSNNTQSVRRKLLPLGLTLAISLLLAGGLLWLKQVSTVSANMPDIALARTTYPTIVGSRIDNCALCHSVVPALNPFGAAYLAGGRGMATSLTNIANVDSDGDGFTNIQEINAHTYPGDVTDFPAALPTATATMVSSATATTAPTATATLASSATATTAPTATATLASSATATMASSATATLTGPTSTKPAVTATKKPRMTGTPSVRPTPVKQCVRDDDNYRKDDKERGSEGEKRPNPCPPDFHDREDHGDRSDNGGDFFNQVMNKVNAWFSGKNH